MWGWLLAIGVLVVAVGGVMIWLQAKLQQPPPDDSPYVPVGRKLAEGPHGLAYMGVGADSGSVVKKTFSTGAAPELQRLQAAGDVHPLVARVTLVQAHAHDTVMVRPHIPGTSLMTIAAQGPLEPARAVAITIDILDGLAALHAQGLHHGNLKLPNVILDYSGRAELLDAGIADGDDMYTLTHDVARVYHLGAIAPEQLEGPATPSTDIYAAGAILYRLITGRCHLPIEELAGPHLLEAIRSAPSRLDDPRIPPGIGEVLDEALAKRPRQRFRDAHEMAGALEAVTLVPGQAKPWTAPNVANL